MFFAGNRHEKCGNSKEDAGASCETHESGH
jgi:hypothetical protein